MREAIAYFLLGVGVTLIALAVIAWRVGGILIGGERSTGDRPQ